MGRTKKIFDEQQQRIKDLEAIIRILVMNQMIHGDATWIEVEKILEKDHT